MFEPSEHRPTEAIIDLNTIQHNIKVIAKNLKPSQLLYATVKANAYGHGSVPVAKASLEAGVKGLLTATVDEAIHLRKNGLTQVPILVLGLTDPRGIAEILHYNLTVTVSNASFFEAAYQQLKETQQLALLDLYQLNIHLALDTGMGRIGLQSNEELQTFTHQIRQYSWVNWRGVFTHFSTAGGGPEAYVHHQFEKWQQLLIDVPEEVIYRHYANSAMGMWYPCEPQSDIVRLGIAMYGMDPKDRPKEDLGNIERQLKPAMQLISELVYVKKVQKGQAISYGATYITESDEWIGTVPIGYADGWFRHYQAIEVLIDGKKCPVVGRINMDQMMVKLPNELPVGTTVTLIGKDGQLENHATDIARTIDTISYEIFCGISDRVPRVYLKE